MLNSADLSNDIDTLKALLLVVKQTQYERDTVTAARDELILGLRAQLTTTEVEIEHLKLMIAKLRLMQVGRNSEKLDHQVEQLELQLEDLQATEGEAKRERPLVDKVPRSKAERKPLPEHLPREERVYQPLRVIRHMRTKLAC